MTTRIGVLFGGLDSKVLEVLKYLITYQNTIQTSFEFHIISPPEDTEYFDRISKKDAYNRHTIKPETREFIAHTEENLRNLAEHYDRRLDRISRFVILTTTKLSDNYYGVSEDNWSLMALGGWQRNMFPPSIVEYFLTFLVRGSLRSAAPAVISHINSRACIFDFNLYLDDARAVALSGFVCDSCSSRMRFRGAAKLKADVNILIQRQWLGNSEKPSDVAVTVKKLGFDLFQTVGVKPSWRDHILSAIKEDGLKSVAKGFGTLLVARLGALLGAYLGIQSSQKP